MYGRNIVMARKMQENSTKCCALAREEIKAGFSHIKTLEDPRFNCALRQRSGVMQCYASERDIQIAIIFQFKFLQIRLNFQITCHRLH